MSSEATRIRRADTCARTMRRVSSQLAILLAVSGVPWCIAQAAGSGDSCLDCHSDRSFLVTNKKLYDYFEQWKVSIHGQEEVTCFDCHGGDPDAADKGGAHAGELAAANRTSAVNFRNIPSTCGACHEEIYDGFRESDHFAHVEKKKQDDEQGPTCVTCHGSINVAVLNVNTVETACSRCHSEESENHPETPEKARGLLNRFLSIHRYYRYITVRGDPAETKSFFNAIDAQIHELSVKWHTFDLESIEEKTEAVLESVRTKREEIAKANKRVRAEHANPSSR